MNKRIVRCLLAAASLFLVVPTFGQKPTPEEIREKRPLDSFRGPALYAAYLRHLSREGRQR
jgi:hypothetical protein